MARIVIEVPDQHKQLLLVVEQFIELVTQVEQQLERKADRLREDRARCRAAVAAIEREANRGLLAGLDLDQDRARKLDRGDLPGRGVAGRGRGAEVGFFGIVLRLCRFCLTASWMIASRNWRYPVWHSRQGPWLAICALEASRPQKSQPM